MHVKLIQYETFIIEGYEKWIEPAKQDATFVLPNFYYEMDTSITPDTLKKVLV